MKTMAPLNKGLTLVELLVVVAVLGVLFILASSGVNRMLEKSRETGCVSNLRQLFQGFMSYANDYNGKLPFGAREPDIPDPNANYYGGVYAREMKAYLPGKGSNTGYTDPYLCPADRTIRAGTSRGFLGHSYGVNMTICRDNYNRVVTWKYPSRTFLLADSINSLISRSNPSNLAPRHRGGANTLFLDGHVEWRPAPFPDWNEDRRFWVPDLD